MFPLPDTECSSCLPGVCFVAWHAWYFLDDVAFLIRCYFIFGMYQQLVKFCVRFYHCMDATFPHDPLYRFCDLSDVRYGYDVFWFFSSTFCMRFAFCLLLFATCCFLLLSAHPGYWQSESACCMCSSSFLLSFSSVTMVAHSHSVLTADSLCTVGCSDVHKSYWSVCVGCLYTVIFMLPSCL